MFFEGAYKLNCFCKLNNKALLAADYYFILSSVVTFSQSTVNELSLQSPKQKNYRGVSISSNSFKRRFVNFKYRCHIDH